MFMATMKKNGDHLVFVYYVTGHGFGHATRVVEVVRHLIAAGHDVHVVTAVPDFVFTSEIQSRLFIRKVLLDCGAVQADALTVDPLASSEMVLLDCGAVQANALTFDHLVSLEMIHVLPNFDELNSTPERFKPRIVYERQRQTLPLPEQDPSSEPVLIDHSTINSTSNTILRRSSRVRHPPDRVGGAYHGLVRIGTFVGRKIMASETLACSLSNDNSDQQVCAMNSDKMEKDGGELLEVEASLDYICNLLPHRYEAISAKKLPEYITGEAFMEKYVDHEDSVTVIDQKRNYAVGASTRHPIYENFRVKIQQRYKSATGFVPFIF